MVTQQELVKSLCSFGIESLDVSLYLNLLRMGSSPVGSISKCLRVDHNRAYRSLNRLKNSGFISTSFSHPTIYQPMPPESALDIVIQTKIDELTIMQKLAKKLIGDLKNFNIEVSWFEGNFNFSIIQGASNIYSRIEKLIQTSINKVFLISTVDDVLRMYYTPIPEKIKMLKEKNVEVNLLTFTKEKKYFPLIKKINASAIRIGRLPSLGRIVAEKQNQLIVSGYHRKSTKLKVEDSVLYTNSRAIINNMYQLCENLWEEAQPINLR